jgi:hypothetical protein
MVRVQPVQLTALDAWIAAQDDPPPSRPEAIRRLVDLGLAATPPVRQRTPKARAKALDLASQQIDQLSDPSATNEEQRQRKRRLLKGPGEFREIRNEIRSKSKT